jgi:hypothetical protein
MRPTFISRIAAIVTGVDLDHMDFLGPDREAIGREKAGIFRAVVPAICGDPQPPQSLINHAGAIGAPLQVMGRDFGYQRQEGQWLYWARGVRRDCPARRAGLPALRGERQLANAACALAALDCNAFAPAGGDAGHPPRPGRGRTGGALPGLAGPARRGARCRPQSAGRPRAGRQPRRHGLPPQHLGRVRHARRQGQSTA